MIPKLEVAVELDLGSRGHSCHLVFCPLLGSWQVRIWEWYGKAQGREPGASSCLLVFCCCFFKLGFPQKRCSLRSLDCEQLLRVSWDGEPGFNKVLSASARFQLP